MKRHFKKIFISLLIVSTQPLLAGNNSVEYNHYVLDSLQTIIESKPRDLVKLEAIHEICKLLYKYDKDHEQLAEYAKEGIQIAQERDKIKEGSDLAVWILRANIYLRRYDRNPQYYDYLKKLFSEGKINKQKIIQPLYSEIYSYLDYGKLREAENKMVEFKQLTDKSNPQQKAYYLDAYVVFKRKAKEWASAARALSEFAELAEKVDDKRFLVTALSRNAQFYLIDSMNFSQSKFYAEKALETIDQHNLQQHRQHVQLQLAQAVYKLGDQDLFENVYKSISVDSFEQSNKIIYKDYFTFSGDIHLDNMEYIEACKDYKKAMQYLENSDFSTMEILTRNIERCYTNLKDYRAAYVYANRLNVLKDSLYNVQNTKDIKFFEAKLRYKDAETERIKLENKIYAQKKSTIYIGFFSSLILLSLLFYNRILDEKVKHRTMALNLKNRELEDSLEELQHFNYIASHDIKEPMRVVSSVTGLIEMKLKKENNTKYNNEFSLVKNSINQLYTLIEDLSQFIDFKAKEFTHQLVDTDLLASQVKQSLGQKIRDINGQIIFNNLPEIYTSNALLTVIFKNLIENGLKYNKSEIPVVNVTYQSRFDNHIYTFEDNGIGIEEKYFDYIFKMFKRLENRTVKGSGLGLGLVAKAIEKLGGSIRIESEVGRGSKFILTLPTNYATAKSA